MPLGRGRIFSKQGRRTNWTRYEIALTVRTNSRKHARGAVCTKSTFKSANHGICDLWWKIAIATFAIRLQLHHDGLIILFLVYFGGNRIVDPTVIQFAFSPVMLRP